MTVCDICEKKIEGTAMKENHGNKLLELCVGCSDQLKRRVNEVVETMKARPAKTLTLNDDKAAVEAAAKRGYQS